ncbi:MAG: hypothetical protein AAGC91_07270 [Pseudomonadota bacterium]
MSKYGEDMLRMKIWTKGDDRAGVCLAAIRPRAIFVFALTALTALNASHLAAAQAPLFESQGSLQISLSGPFSQINQERDKSKEYPAKLRYEHADSEHSFDVKLSVRGNYRLQRDICRYAQLWVNFRKKQVQGTLFDGQNKLKLVVQCRDGDRYLDYLAREQQAYRMYESLTDLSLRSRWMTVSYEDPDSGKSREHSAFFIEHHRQLAERKAFERHKAPTAARGDLDPYQSTLASLFMYLVSNTDYSLIAAAPGESCCHNVKLLRAGNGVLFPVPYDFDSTGFVNARYASPSENLKQKSVTQRIYRGYCVDDDVFDQALARIIDQKDALLAVSADTSVMPAKRTRRAQKYVNEFFDTVENERKRKSKIQSRCR